VLPDISNKTILFILWTIKTNTKMLNQTKGYDEISDFSDQDDVKLPKVIILVVYCSNK